MGLNGIFTEKLNGKLNGTYHEVSILAGAFYGYNYGEINK
jgi:hypothetical protein